MKTKTKYFALLHDGTMNGDSIFWFPDARIPYVKDMSLNDIKQAYANTPDLRNDPEWCKDIMEEVKGAVIIADKTLAVLKAIAVDSAFSDTVAYAYNRAAKRVAWLLKESSLGKEMH